MQWWCLYPVQLIQSPLACSFRQRLKGLHSQCPGFIKLVASLQKLQTCCSKVAAPSCASAKTNLLDQGGLRVLRAARESLDVNTLLACLLELPHVEYLLLHLHPQTHLCGPAAALKGEGVCYHTHCQDALLPGQLCNHWCCTCACAAPHACSDEYHVSTGQCSLQLLHALLGSLLPKCRLQDTVAQQASPGTVLAALCCACCHCIHDCSCVGTARKTSMRQCFKPEVSPASFKAVVVHGRH